MGIQEGTQTHKFLQLSTTIYTHVYVHSFYQTDNFLKVQETGKKTSSNEHLLRPPFAFKTAPVLVGALAHSFSRYFPRKIGKLKWEHNSKWKITKGKCEVK